MGDKAAFERQHEEKINEMTAEIERLKARARQSDGASQQRDEEKVAELEALRQEAENNLNTLKQSNEDAWSDVGTALESIAKSLATAIRTADRDFKK